MNDCEILARGRRDFNAGMSFRQRLRGEKSERQMRDGFPELGTIGAVPGINFVEAFERGAFSGFDDADQVESGVGDGPGFIGKSNQRENDARGPDFGEIGLCGFERGKRKDDVANGAGADLEASHRRCLTSVSAYPFSGLAVFRWVHRRGPVS